MAKKAKTVITGPMIKVEGDLARHQIVKKVVNTFIRVEHSKKGKGIAFKYPVEILPDNQLLYIARPGHKKNFDFKVEVVINHGLGEGTHKEIANDLRKKRKENKQKFNILLKAVAEIYHCTENDADIVLKKYRSLKNSFQKSGEVESLLKIIKWLFIMEDIVYWDNEGRTFLFNFLRYVAAEKNEKRLKDALGRITNPDVLKRFMKKCGIDWVPCEK